jgi:hypothetical protein
MRGWIIDAQRPVTPAEEAAWKVFLALPRDQWDAARTMFRRVHCGVPLAAALRGFTAETGATDPEALATLEKALRGLAEDGAH